MSIRTTLLMIIGVLNVLIAIMVGVGVYQSVIKFRDARILMEGSSYINLLYVTNRYLSLERASSLSVLYVENDTRILLQKNIIADRQKADEALTASLKGVSNSTDENVKRLIVEVQKDYSDLQSLRVRLDHNISAEDFQRDEKIPDQFFEKSTHLIITLRDLILAYEQPLRNIDPVVCQQMIAKYFIWEVTEYAGREYAVIGRAISENKPMTIETHENLLSWKNLIQSEWEVARRYIVGGGLDAHLKPYLDEVDSHYFLTFSQTKDIFYTSESLTQQDAYPLSIEMWLELASQAVDSLLTLKQASLQETQEYVNLLENKAKNNILFNMFLFLCALSISLYCFVIILRRVIHPVNAMVDALYQTAQEVGGSNSVALPSNYDEISKLAAVLKAFEQNVRKIEQSNVELERYAYITAHDLQTPLRAIDNLSQWIEEDLGASLVGQTKEHMSTLRQRVRRMEKLLNDTLRYSRLEKDIREMKGDLMNGKVLIEDAISLTAPSSDFVFKIDRQFSDLSLVQLPLQQIFYNLINNAVKHSAADHGVIEIKVHEEPEHYIFSVNDNGPGIPKQYQEKVFEMFQTVKSRDKKEGSGMGLAFVRKILTTCGGTITLDSEVGKGCSFKFTWPKNQAI